MILFIFGIFLSVIGRYIEDHIVLPALLKETGVKPRWAYSEKLRLEQLEMYFEVCKKNNKSLIWYKILNTVRLKMKYLIYVLFFLSTVQFLIVLINKQA